MVLAPDKLPYVELLCSWECLRPQSIWRKSPTGQRRIKKLVSPLSARPLLAAPAPQLPCLSSPFQETARRRGRMTKSRMMRSKMWMWKRERKVMTNTPPQHQRAPDEDRAGREAEDLRVSAGSRWSPAAQLTGPPKPRATEVGGEAEEEAGGEGEVVLQAKICLWKTLTQV